MGEAVPVLLGLETVKEQYVELGRYIVFHSTETFQIKESRTFCDLLGFRGKRSSQREKAEYDISVNTISNLRPLANLSMLTELDISVNLSQTSVLQPSCNILQFAGF